MVLLIVEEYALATFAHLRRPVQGVGECHCEGSRRGDGIVVVGCPGARGRRKVSGSSSTALFAHSLLKGGGWGWEMGGRNASSLGGDAKEGVQLRDKEVDSQAGKQEAGLEWDGDGLQLELHYVVCGEYRANVYHFGRRLNDITSTMLHSQPPTTA